MAETPALVVGAGLAGLSCAAAIGRSCRVVERDGRPGGLCRTERWSGFTVDWTGHYLHFRDPEVRRMVFRLMGPNLARCVRDSWVRVGGRLTPYPFQANLFGHPGGMVRECLAGFLRARGKAGPAPRNYREWILRTFGDGFARHFMFPFNEKQFLVPLTRLTPLQAGRFVPRPSVDEVVRGAQVPGGVGGFGYNAVMWHPRRGGIESLVRALTGGRRVETGKGLVRLDWRRREALLGDGERVGYGALVSSAPLPELLGLLDPLPAGIGRARRDLAAIGTLCVNVLVRNPRERRRHWIYVPGREARFYRVGFPSNAVPADAPRRCGIISAEVSYLPGRRPGVPAVERRVRRDLVRMGLMGSRDAIKTLTFDLPCAYVLFDHAYAGARRAALSFLARNGILSVGRYGGWVYGGMEDAMRQGLDAGRLVRSYGARAGRHFKVES